MFQVIVVDDESAALNRFERIALEDERITLAGKFLYADEAIDCVKKQSIDIAFLDIEMPEMNGLELAEQLMEIDPYLSVVFVTAYNQYTLDAFRAHAIGYLLKPLDKDELTEQIDIISRRHTRIQQRGGKQRLKVKCFGQLSVCEASGSAPVIRWKTVKAEELFALLIHHEGKTRPRENIIDTLWPELEPSKSANLFRVTCTYLRSALAEIGFTDVLQRELDGYKINVELIDCDYFNLRSALSDLSHLDLHNLEETSALYDGNYLEGKSYEWAFNMRTYLESEFRMIQFRLTDQYCARGKITEACGALEKILNRDPCDEETVLRFINLKIQSGDNVSAMRLYKEYTERLEKELGLFPTEKLQKLMQHINT